MYLAIPNTKFSVIIPNSRLRTAIRGANWEGVGVVPDVAVSSSDALSVAHDHALRQLLILTPNGSWHEQLTRELQELQAQPAPH
jgi:hypothetical protein